MANAPSTIINGVLYKNPIEEKEKVFTESGSLETMTVKNSDDINKYIVEMKNFLVGNQEMIFKGYKIAKNKTDYIIQSNKQREFYNLCAALDSYKEYMTGMFEYVSMALSIQPGEVTPENIKIRLVTALNNDEQWIRRQFVSKKDTIREGMKTAECILDFMKYIGELKIIVNTMTNKADIDNIDDEALRLVKTNAIELVWRSLKTFSAVFTDCVKKNFEAISDIVNDKPIHESVSEPLDGFRML